MVFYRPDLSFNPCTMTRQVPAPYRGKTWRAVLCTGTVRGSRRACHGSCTLDQRDGCKRRDIRSLCPMKQGKVPARRGRLADRGFFVVQFNDVRIINMPVSFMGDLIGCKQGTP